MATRAELIAALLKAAAAGDTDGATHLAAALQATPESSAQPSEQDLYKASNANADKTVTRAVLGGLGLPADTLVNAANLGIAGYGTAKQALGFGPGPNVIDPAHVPLTSAWNINKAGPAAQPDQPTTVGGKYLNAAESGLPYGAPGVAYSMAAQAINDMLPADTNESARALAQVPVMFGPGLAAGGFKAAAASRLKSIATDTPARSALALTNAGQYMGGNLTLAQTSNSGLVRTLAGQVQGQRAANAGQVQADVIGLRLAQQARRLAPLPITTPGASTAVASKIGDAIDKMHTDLTKQASDSYARGVGQVAALGRAKPEPVAFPNLTATFKRLQGEKTDVFNTAPAELQGRVNNLLTSLGGGNESWQQKLNGEGITAATAADAMKLGKSLNQQFNATERGAITPAMDAVFAQLKSAYHADLEAAPSNPAIDRARSVNREYVQAQDRIGQLQDSVVNGVVGSLKTKDPDTAIKKLSQMEPAAQQYTRSVLQKYDPQTLKTLQGSYIDLHLNDASPAGRPSFKSKVDIHALNPETLAKSGLFDPKDVLELNQAQDAINTIRNFFPETVGNKVGANLQESSRLVGGAAGGAVSPVFALGAALRVFTGGKLEKLLLTPEGRQSLMKGASDPNTALNLIRQLAIYHSAVGSQLGPQPTADQAAQ